MEAEPRPMLLVSNVSGTTQLYSMQPDGSEVRQLTDDAAAPVLDAVWSPDGRKIALVISEGQNGIVSKATGHSIRNAR